MEEPKARIVCDESQVGPRHARSVDRVEQGRVDEIQGRPMDAGIVNARADDEDRLATAQILAWNSADHYCAKFVLKLCRIDRILQNQWNL